MTITSNAFDLLLGFAEHTAADQRIKDEITRNRAVEFDAPITSADFAVAALSGDEFPNDPHFHNEQILSARLNAAARGELLKNAAKDLQRRKMEIIRDHSAAALAYVATELTALVEQVRSVNTMLGHIRTAEEVLDAGPEVHTAWRERAELISRYSEIRDAQRSLTIPGLGDGDNFKIATVGYVRNSLEQTDFWLSRRQDAASDRPANDRLEGVRNFNDWLGKGGVAPFKHSTSAIPQTDTHGNPTDQWDYLVWLATKAEPWVPTPAQVLAAFDAAHIAVAETDYKKFHAQEAARDRYFEVIGVTPLVGYTNSATDKPEVRRVKRPSFGEAAASSMGL